MNKWMRTNQAGFTLLELAIAMLVLGIILASFFGIFGLLSDTGLQKKERENMQRIHDSLNMYLLVNSHLPCPDEDGDGLEDRDSTADPDPDACKVASGGLPYNDLGVPDTDAWGHPYYYQVQSGATDGDQVHQVCKEASVFGKKVTDTAPLGLDGLKLCTESNIYYCDSIGSSVDVGCDAGNYVTVSTKTQVNDPDTGNLVGEYYLDPRPNVVQEEISPDESSAPFFHLATPPIGGHMDTTNNLTVYNQDFERKAEGVVAVVVSWGANGDKVNNANVANCSAAPAEEQENCNGDVKFVDTKTGEDRDFLTWVTVNQAKVAIIKTGDLQ